MNKALRYSAPRRCGKPAVWLELGGGAYLACAEHIPACDGEVLPDPDVRCGCDYPMDGLGSTRLSKVAP